MTEQVELNKETTLHLAEHEILLSFTNDSGAIAFDEWWYAQGKAMFDKWVEGDHSEEDESYEENLDHLANQIDWSVAPKGTTHLYTGQGKITQPEGEGYFEWEMWTDEGIYEWTSDGWDFYESDAPKSMRIRRP